MKLQDSSPSIGKAALRSTFFLPGKEVSTSINYRIQYSDDKSAIIRFPLPGFFRFAEEKLLAEVAAIRYFAKNTTIPVPLSIHHGMTEDSLWKLGPFIIME